MGARNGLASSPEAAVSLLPPQDLEAEQSVLGAVLLSPALLEGFEDIGLEPDDFYRPSHGAIYAAMLDLRANDERIDKLTVSARLKRHGQLEAAGGTAGVECLAAAPPVLGHASDYARIVKDTAGIRGLLTETHRIQKMIATHVGDPQALFEQVQRSVTSVTSVRARTRLRPMFPDGVDAISDEDISWRCGGFAADGHITVIAGEGGEGKSLVTLLLAKGVQGGQTVAGFECSMGKVVMIDAENGSRIMAKRLKAAQISLADLEIYDAESVDIRNPQDQRDVLKACEGAQLVVLDSLRMLAPGAKENDSDEMAPVMKFCKSISRRTGAAVILVHHKGKGEGDYRGSSAIRDQTDLLFVLERHRGDPMGRNRRSIRCVKCRVDQEPPTRWISIVGGKDLAFIESAPYDPSEEAPSPKRDAMQERIIATIGASDGPLKRPDMAKRLGVAHNHKTFLRAVEALVDADVLAMTKGQFTRGVKWPSTPADTPDTGVSSEGVSPLKGKDTSTPPQQELPTDTSAAAA